MDICICTIINAIAYLAKEKAQYGRTKRRKEKWQKDNNHHFIAYPFNRSYSILPFQRNILKFKIALFIGLF